MSDNLNIRRVCAEAALTLATVAVIPSALLVDRLFGYWQRRGLPDWRPIQLGLWFDALLIACLGALVVTAVARVLSSEGRRFPLLAWSLGAAGLFATPFVLSVDGLILVAQDLGLLNYNPLMSLAAAVLMGAGAWRFFRPVRN